MSARVDIHGLSAKEVRAIPFIVDAIRLGRQASPVHGQVIWQKIGLTGGSFRRIVNRLRAAGYEIGLVDGSGESTGYFWADKAAELDGAIQSLEGRVGAMLSAIKGLKRRQLQMIAKVTRDERIRLNQSIQPGPDGPPADEQAQLSLLA